MRRFFYFLLVTMSFIVLTYPVLAKGSASRIDISGPGFDGVVVLTDTAFLEVLSIARLENFVSGSIEVPFNDPLAETYYELNRYIRVNGDEAVMWDTVRYYPDPDGGRGYIHYVGMANGWSEYDNHWFWATSQGEVAIHQLLERQSETVWQRLRSQFAQLLADVLPEAGLVSLTAQGFTLQP